MIALQNPPEFADGGYWYRRPVVSPDDDPDARTVDMPSGWSAQYKDGVAVVRVVTPVSVDNQQGDPTDRFLARIGGR